MKIEKNHQNMPILPLKYFRNKNLYTCQTLVSCFFAEFTFFSWFWIVHLWMDFSGEPHVNLLVLYWFLTWSISYVRFRPRVCSKVFSFAICKLSNIYKSVILCVTARCCEHDHELVHDISHSICVALFFYFERCTRAFLNEMECHNTILLLSLILCRAYCIQARIHGVY